MTDHAIIFFGVVICVAVAVLFLVTKSNTQHLEDLEGKLARGVYWCLHMDPVVKRFAKVEVRADALLREVGALKSEVDSQNDDFCAVINAISRRVHALEKKPTKKPKKKVKP